MIKRQAIFFCGKNRFRNVQVLHIVYLIPLFPLQRQGFQFTFIQQCNHPKHLLVILIIAQSLSIRFQKGNIIRSGELFAELVDIAKEKERLSKEREKLIKEVERVEKKLSNQGFVSKAPEKVIAEEKAKMEKYSTMLKAVEEQIERLK